MRPTNSTISFTTVLDTLTAALRGAFPERGFVRLCAAPDDRIPEYIAKDGIVLRVRSPAPMRAAGGGRYAPVTNRLVDVIIVTRSYTDAAGEDDRAVYSHIQREERVLNVLHLIPNPAILYEWSSSGEEIARRVRTDKGLLVSVVTLNIQYAPPMDVRI